MRSRRLFQVIVGLATLMGPLAAVAHAEFSGTVTTAPYLGAPAMGMPLLALLAVLLAGFGAYLLRRRRCGVVAKVALAAALTALAGLAYATDGVTIEGADCGMRTVHPFIPVGVHILTSNCPNAIQILSITVNCDDPNPSTPCTVGQVLTQGQRCNLPACVMM
jgi:hypothetical protein